MKIQAAIFDRDGVLTYFDVRTAVRTLRPLLPIGIPELVGYWEAWGERVGFPRDLSEEEAFWIGLWDYVADELGLETAVRERLYQFSYLKLIKPYRDARPALELARSRGLKTAVLSNFSLASIDASLEAAGLADLVDVARSATMIGAAKPAPQAYGHVLAELNVPAEACLFFDDEVSCIEGARAVGLQAYRVDREGEGALADGVIADLGALEGLLGG